MPHNGARDRQWLARAWLPGRAAEGVMVRRLSVASLDSGAESPVYGEEPSASADRDPGGKPPWTDGGGRGAAWPMRGNDTTGATAPEFPVMLGESFSMRSGRDYLNYSPSTAARRAERLAAFIAEDVRNKDQQFKHNGSGTSFAESTKVAGIDVHSADTAAVTLPGSVNRQPTELGGPRYASDGRPVVPGPPDRLPAPPVAVLPRAQQASSVSFDGITSLPVPRRGATRDTTATADWTISDQVGTGSPTLVASYDMSVIDQQSGRWYVKDIRASTQPMGTP